MAGYWEIDDDGQMEVNLVKAFIFGFSMNILINYI